MARVSHTRMGIPAESLEAGFDSFNQAHGKAHGLLGGMGPAISRLALFGRPGWERGAAPAARPGQAVHEGRMDERAHGREG